VHTKLHTHHANSFSPDSGDVLELDRHVGEPLEGTRNLSHVPDHVEGKATEDYKQLLTADHGDLLEAHIDDGDMLEAGRDKLQGSSFGADDGEVSQASLDVGDLLEAHRDKLQGSGSGKHEKKQLEVQLEVKPTKMIEQLDTTGNHAVTEEPHASHMMQPQVKTVLPAEKTGSALPDEGDIL